MCQWGEGPQAVLNKVSVRIWGVWGAEPLAQSLWLKAKEIVRANGEPPIVDKTSRSARPTRAKRALKSWPGALCPAPYFVVMSRHLSSVGETS